jgi:hypothetical protein
MTIERDYATDDQQVPDSTTLQENSAGAAPSPAPVKRQSSLPDFDTLLVDLVDVGALDAEAVKDVKNDMALAYASERSFYDDYTMQHIKREEKDFYGQPEYVNDLSFLAEDAPNYGYGSYGQMPTESLDSSPDMASEDVIQKIERASMELGISKNPYQWKSNIPSDGPSGPSNCTTSASRSTCTWTALRFACFRRKTFNQMLRLWRLFIC